MRVGRPRLLGAGDWSTKNVIDSFRKEHSAATPVAFQVHTCPRAVHEQRAPLIQADLGIHPPTPSRLDSRYIQRFRFSA